MLKHPMRLLGLFVESHNFAIILIDTESSLLYRAGRSQSRYNVATGQLVYSGEPIMAKIDESELGDDFRYILRLAMADVDGMKPIGLGLTSITGVGHRTATALCEIAGVDKKKLGGNLSDDELGKLSDAIESYADESVSGVPTWMLNRQWDLHSGAEMHLFSQDVSMVQKEDIDRQRAVKNYRGIRHALGKRVRGQRTRSNGRTGLTLGVQRKK